MRTTLIMVLLVGLWRTGRAEAQGRLYPDELKGPIPEIVTPLPRVALPPLPSFEVAPDHAGYHTPSELRQRGKRWLGHELLVKGFVTGIYDCVADLSAKKPGTSRGVLVEMIENDPTVCQLPRFYLGQAPSIPRSLSISVVEVPRPPRRIEKKNMTLADEMRWPEVPKLAEHDYLGVTGLWALESPHGERDSNGLLIYRHVQPEVASADVLTEGTKMTSIEPAVAVMTRVPLRRLIGNEQWNASVERLNTCTHELAEQRFDAAVVGCSRAIQIWGDNHLAWYGLAAAHLAKREWDQAVYPARQAMALRPDVAMYQLYYGIALYQSLRDRAEKAAAAEHGFHVRLIDPTTFQRDSARDAFRRAVTLMPGLWRAHYYLATMELEDGEAALAARQLDQAIVTNPSYEQSYLALAELYLRWGYRDEALAVAKAGTQRIAPHDAVALWYELGTIYEAEHALPEAVEAFTRVIEVSYNHVLARFHRGRIYADIGKRLEARDDLMIAAGARDPEFAVEQQLAGQLLWSLGPKR